MKFVVLLIAGVASVVFSGQGLIRLLVDHDNRGVLGGLPFAGALCAYVAALAVGTLLAGWAKGRAKALGHVK
ncbi:hypothetical protein [Streptomyces alfalfae]|uniref:Uncharacterized protein n=1 Tax=Streptomyces alfalfae TaxID=1642299 RepID=A0A7T4PC37_9ACTN|nr:hypothetical protein [Streptomyces alfalfae]QQC87385.1 hypothetical protein I8755_02390 [Streptomyces alfalfae]